MGTFLWPSRKKTFFFSLFKNKSQKNQYDHYVLAGDIPGVTYNNEDHYKCEVNKHNNTTDIFVHCAWKD